MAKNLTTTRIIERCLQCPNMLSYHRAVTNNIYVCKVTEDDRSMPRVINWQKSDVSMQSDEIPDFCPLADFVESEETE